MNYKTKKNEIEYIIDRTSPLGNPYVLYNELERDNTCDKHAEWFYIQIEKENEHILDVCNDMLNKLIAGYTIILKCHCHPKRCHGETIKKYLLDELAYMQGDEM